MGIYDEYKPPETAGKYFKWVEGHTHVLRLASEPVVFEKTFKDRAQTRYAWVIWNVEEKIAQVLEGPLTVFKEIQKYAKDPEYGDPEKYSFKMTRTGTGLDTEYSIVASPNKCTLGELADAAPEAVRKINLIDAVSGDNVEHVFWLRDVMNVEKKKAVPVSDQTIANDRKVVIEDIDPRDKPIDLSEIPFN